MLLDLSAAFDTVDCDILISTLETHIEVVDKALDSFKSYLSYQHQSVYINSTKSDTKERRCGIPQGSALGPDLFAIFSLPLADLVHILSCTISLLMMVSCISF